MDEDPLSVQTGDDQETIAQMFQKYDILTLPVVDSEKRLVGIITIDDAVDVIQEENTEDIEKMAAILPGDKPYLKTSVFDLWKRRIPWLLLLMISATFTGNIITSFEDKLSAYIVLTAYIPMLMDTGGNCGSQASTTVIRGLSLGEVQFRDIFRVIWKEIRVAVLCSVTLAVCNFFKLLLVDRLEMMVALTICMTLVVTVCCSKLIGCTLPLFAKKLGFDPRLWQARLSRRLLTQSRCWFILALRPLFCTSETMFSCLTVILPGSCFCLLHIWKKARCKENLQRAFSAVTTA